MNKKVRLKELTEKLQAAIDETEHLRNEVRSANAVLLRIDGMMTQLITEVRACCPKPPSTSS